MTNADVRVEEKYRMKKAVNENDRRRSLGKSISHSLDCRAGKFERRDCYSIEVVGGWGRPRRFETSV